MKLAELILDTQLLADLKAFLLEKLTEEGVRRMFDGESVVAYPEARLAIENVFSSFEEMSGRNKEKIENNNDSPR